jgi:hypothetical protein
VDARWDKSGTETSDSCTPLCELGTGCIRLREIVLVVKLVTVCC